MAKQVVADKDRDKNKDKKGEALERALSQLEKQYYKGIVMRMGSHERLSVPAISTGSLSLDLALGINGVPRGRVIEIFGPEASGKTTLALQIVANAQKQGGVAAFIDAEHAIDPEYAKKLGVDLDELLINQPDTGEQALDIVETLVRSSAVDIIVVDSVAALTPKAEIEGNMGDMQIGLQARLMSQAMRKLSGVISKSNTCLVFINQIREKIGVMFGNPETTPGGRALKFYASVRIEVRRIGIIKDGDRAIGNRVRAMVVKNKVAPPFRKTEFDLMYKGGISFSGDVVDLALAHNIVDKSGAWFSYGKIRLGQGRENTKTFLEENPKLMEEIKQVVLQKLASAEQATAGKRKDAQKD
ncbi:MAG: recombinase RecA [Candidatus Brocadiales bacterium]|nr:recombinase RecA [Candidatus Bathyanammoxibius sp.]MCQ4573672.1 recombinase RecA [Candidatus Bathyanammoxibius amoris]